MYAASVGRKNASHRSRSVAGKAECKKALLQSGRFSDGCDRNTCLYDDRVVDGVDFLDAAQTGCREQNGSRDIRVVHDGGSRRGVARVAALSKHERIVSAGDAHDFRDFFGCGGEDGTQRAALPAAAIIKQKRS